MYFKATEYFVFSRPSLIAPISGVKMDAQSGNLMEITVFKKATVFLFHEPSV